MHGAPLTGRGGCLSKLALKISVLSVVISTVNLMSAVPYSPTSRRFIVFSHSHISFAQKCTSNRRTLSDKNAIEIKLRPETSLQWDQNNNCLM